MNKRLKIAAAAALGLVVALLLAVSLWVSLGGLDDFIKRRLVRDLERMNVCAEIGDLKLGLRASTVTIEGLVLRVCGSNDEPFARVEKAYVKVDIKDYYQGQFDLRELVLTRPVITVTYNEDGTSNLTGIELPRSDTPSARRQMAWLAAAVTIEDGEIVYGDARHKLVGTIDNLGVSLLPKGSTDQPGDYGYVNHTLRAAFAGSRLVVDGREMADIAADLEADVTDDGATVRKLELRTPAGVATVSGAIKSWRELEYELDTRLDMNAGTIADLLDPNAGIGGQVAVDGKLAGKGAAYTFSGDLSGDNLFSAGVAADALRARVDRLEREGDRYDFTGDATVGRFRARGVDAADLRFDGRVRAEGGDASVSGDVVVGRVSGPDFNASGVRFRGDIDASGGRTAVDGNFTADRFESAGTELADAQFEGEGTIADGEAAFLGLATVRRAAGRDFQADAIRFKGRFGTAGGGMAAGDVTLTSLTTRTVRVGSIRGRVAASGGRVEVNDLAANVYDGSVRGRATLNLRGGGASSIVAEFTGVDIDRALGAASPDAPKVNGLASGRVDLRWPGMNLNRASGTVTADIDGTVPAEGGALPLDGQIALTAVPGGFRVDRAELASNGSRIEATGTVGWDRRADLRVKAQSPEASNLTALVSAINPDVGRRLADAGVTLGGEFLFSGSVAGSISNPVVRGDVSIGDVAIAGADGTAPTQLGRFTATLERTGAGFSLANGKLAAPGGGGIEFDVSLPTAGTQQITARLDRVPVAPLLVQFGVAPGTLSGIASGTLNLSVPPGETAFVARVFDEGATGRVDVTVADATLQGERVDDLAVRATFGGKRATLESMRVVSSRGTFTLDGMADLTGNTYRLNLAGENVDLDLLESLAGRNLGLAGRADVTATLAGVPMGPVTEMTANVIGREVMVNGERIEDARIAVVTEGTKATVRATGRALGEPRELVATIDLADEALPFAATFDLNGTDFVTLARLIPGMAIPEGVTGRATGRVDVKGSLNSDDGFSPSLVVSGTLSELAVNVAVDTTGRQYGIANEGPVTFRSEPGVLHVERATFVGEGTRLTVEGDYAYAALADSTPASNLTLNGDVNLALLSSLTESAYAAGVATLSASVMGPAGNPRFGGHAELTDASLRVVDFPLSFYDGNGRIRFNENQAQIENFTALSGGGRIRAGGGVLFAGLRPSRWRFELDASQVRATYPQDVRSIIDGALVLQGNPELQVLSGVVNVRRAEYTEEVDLVGLAEIGRSGSLPRDPAAGPASPIRLDLRVEARDSIVIRNNLADVVASASLVLTGPINDPIVDGRATVSRGTLEFRQGEYRVTRGVVRFPGTQAGDITFDIQAESEIQDYRVTLGLTGTPERFYPTFRSDPVLPQAQIISLVLTGELGSEPTGVQALTQTSIGVAGSLIGEAVSRTVEKRTDRLFGINRFRIDPVLVGGSDPSARVTIGRRVNRNLSIIYSTNISSTEEQVIQLEYRISDRVRIVAAREEDGSFGIDVRFRKRF